MRAALFAVLLWSGLAEASEFDGTWVLDREASDSYGPVMDAQGIPGWQQKIAGTMKMTQILEDGGGAIDVTFKASVFTERYRWVVDGTPHTGDNKRVEQTEIHTRRPDGSIESTITWTAPDGRPVRLEVKRVVTDDTLRIHTVFHLGDDAPRTFERVFHRQD